MPALLKTVYTLQRFQVEKFIQFVKSLFGFWLTILCDTTGRCGTSRATWTTRVWWRRGEWKKKRLSRPLTLVIINSRSEFHLFNIPESNWLGILFRNSIISRTRAKTAHTAGAYPGFCSMQQLRVLLLFPGWDARPSQGCPRQYVAGDYFYTSGWREAIWGKVSWLQKQHDGRDWASNHRPSDLKSNSLTNTPPKEIL